MNLLAIYVANGVGIYIMLMLIYTSNTRILAARPEDRIYSLVCFGVMIGCFFEAFSYTIDGHLFPGSIFLNYFSNTYLYTFNMLLPLLLVFYIDIGIYEKPERILALYKPQIILALAMASLNIINFFVPIIYDVSLANVYSRRPLSYLFYVVIIYFFVSAYLLEKRYEKENGTRSFFNINTFLIPISIGVGLQFMVYGLSVAWLSCSIGLVGLYIMQQNEVAYIDPLADTYNRQYFDYVLSSWISKGDGFAGVMFDVDRFKRINDTFGHSEGDNALKTVTDILKAARKENEMVFRLAGDEFIVLKKCESQEGLNEYIAEVEKKLTERNVVQEKYKLSLSYGSSYFRNGDQDTFLKDMDDKMYEMKARHHKEEKTVA